MTLRILLPRPSYKSVQSNSNWRRMNCTSVGRQVTTRPATTGSNILLSNAVVALLITAPELLLKLTMFKWAMVSQFVRNRQVHSFFAPLAKAAWLIWVLTISILRWALAAMASIVFVLVQKRRQCQLNWYVWLGDADNRICAWNKWGTVLILSWYSRKRIYKCWGNNVYEGNGHSRTA